MIFNILLLLLILFFLILSILICVKKRIPIQTKIAFVLMSFALISWQVALIYSSYIYDYPFLHRVTFVSALWLAEGWYLISVYYPDRKIGARERIVMWIQLFLDIVFTYILLDTNKIITGYDLLNKEVLFSGLESLLFIYFIAKLILIIRKLYLRFKKEGQSRLYLKYVFYGISFYGLFALIFNLFLPIFGYSEYSIMGSLLGIVPSVSIFYTLTSSHIYSSKFLLGKFLYYSILIIFSFGILVGFIFLIIQNNYFNDKSDFVLILIFFTGVFVFLVEILGNWLNKQLHAFFVEQQYKYENIQKEFFDGTNGHLEIFEIEKFVKKFFKEKFLINIVDMAVFKDNSFVYVSDNDVKQFLNQRFRDIEIFSRSEDVNILDKKFYLQLFSQSKFETLVVIKEDGRINIILCLGSKQNNELLTSEEIVILETFSKILNLTIGRSLLDRKSVV